MMEISDAIVLMAGRGSRLGFGPALPKPLAPVLGRPLATYIIEALQRIGVQQLHVVVGANSDALVETLGSLVPSPMSLHPISNLDWQKQNGISVLCAAGKLREPFLLAMGDHLFDAAILERLLQEAEPARLNLAIDRKIDSIFDLDDAMKVQTKGDAVIAIGKNLAIYDAIDTGLFICPNELFDYLRRAQREGDCSLADGVRLMASDGNVRAIDIGDAWWQDVDTPEMYAHAEAHFREVARSLV